MCRAASPNPDKSATVPYGRGFRRHGQARRDSERLHLSRYGQGPALEQLILELLPSVARCYKGLGWSRRSLIDDFNRDNQSDMHHSEIVSFIWGVADLIRDTFKRGKYQDVILPLTVLRRLDSVLAPTKVSVLAANAKFKGRLEDPTEQLCKASGCRFYNTSLYDFEKLPAGAPNAAKNLRNYIAGFRPNMREVIEKFDFDNTISKLNESGLLFKVLERFKNVDLHPDKIDNP